jgi:hypothetical protein
MGYNQGNVSIHMFGPGFNFFQLNPTITVPYNNQNVNDLWYYIAAVIDPASAPNPQVRVYTKCQRTGSSQDPGSQGCGSDGEVISGAGWDGLYRRRAQSIDWYPELDQNVDRKTWVGKSFWPDYDFKGKMRDLRVWDRALSESELNQPITVNFTADTRQSTLISNSARNESMRISPLYKFGNDRLLYITVKETETAYKNTWRLVSCAWNHKTLQRQSQSLRFRVLGTRRPEAIEYLPY